MLVATAKELNEVMGLIPEIDTTKDDITIIEAIQQAMVHILPEDEWTPETEYVLSVISESEKPEEELEDEIENTRLPKESKKKKKKKKKIAKKKVEKKIKIKKDELSEPESEVEEFQDVKPPMEKKRRITKKELLKESLKEGSKTVAELQRESWYKNEKAYYLYYLIKQLRDEGLIEKEGRTIKWIGK